MTLTPMKFRRKPAVIEALQFDGSITSWREICDAYEVPYSVHHWMAQTMEIDTLEGVMTASKGDWIVRGIAGELYPVKGDLFDKLYEVESDKPPVTKHVLETEMFRITVEGFDRNGWDTERLTLELTDGVMTTDTFQRARGDLFDGNKKKVPLLSVERQ